MPMAQPLEYRIADVMRGLKDQPRHHITKRARDDLVDALAMVGILDVDAELDGRIVVLVNPNEGGAPHTTRMAKFTQTWKMAALALILDRNPESKLVPSRKHNTLLILPYG